METEFVNPNLHVVWVHFPIALLVVGTLIELFSFLWRRHGFRAGGRWMILLGALGGIPTVTSGIYALYDVANPSADLVQWHQVLEMQALSTEQWEVLTSHVWLQSIATGLAVLVVVVWIACSDRLRARLHLPLLALLLLSAGFTVGGAWYGGEAVYRYGVGVMSDDAPHHSATSGPSTTESVALAQRIEHYAPPMQMHVIGAGFAVALAMASIGLSIRKITQGPPVTQVDHIAAALGPPPTLVGGDGPDTLAEPQDLHSPRVPASRFWLLTMLVALGASAGGFWVLASLSETWDPNLLLALVRDYPRRLAHVIAGGAIIVLPLLLAILARWAPRQKILLAVFTLLLVGAIAAQIWFGILLMYDTSEGPLAKFN